jgi:ATP-dependent Lon protease
MLQVADLRERAGLLLAHLTKELQMLEMKNEIQSKVRTEVDKQQREYFLHQQIKTIQDELGGNPIELEIEEMRAKAAQEEVDRKSGRDSSRKSCRNCNA